jgi:DNA primase
MAFPLNFVDKLRSNIAISSVIGKKVKLKKRGKDLLGLCPFHQEKTPSFTVNDQKGLYYCFGCGAGGDMIKFISETEKLNYSEAIKKIASDFNIEFPKYNKTHTNNDVARKYLLLNTIQQFFWQNLQHNLLAKQYLASRGLNETTSNFFQLGFASNSYNDLVNFLQKQNFNNTELLETGIFGHKNNKIFNKFRQRIIFPIYNSQQQVVAFGGRSLDNELPKYLNSAETVFFKKNQILYNFSFAKKNIINLNFALLVEGYIDVITLYQYGFNNVVSGLGTAISQNHVQQIFSITNKIIACLDGDEAGIRATRKLIEITLPLIKPDKNICFIFLPNKLDPDDFLKIHGKEQFQQLIGNAKTLSQTIFDFALQELNFNQNNTNLQISAEQKINLEQILNQKLELIKNNVCKKHFTNFFKDQIFLLGRNFKYKKKIDKTIILPKPTFDRQENILISILALIIKFPNLIDYVDNNFNLRELCFESNQLDCLKDFIINYFDNQSNISNEKILSEIATSEFNNYLTEINNKMQQPSCNSEYLEIKLRILLLKNLLLKIENEYQQTLKNSNTCFEKIQGLFLYKNDINNQIDNLEQQIFI